MIFDMRVLERRTVRQHARHRHSERVPDLQRYLRRRIDSDPAMGARFDEALGRVEGYRAHCERLRAAAGPPVADFDVLIEETIRFGEEFERTRYPREAGAPDLDRRRNPRTPGKGRTGREEWT